MKLYFSIAAASVLTLGVSTLAGTALATPPLTTAFPGLSKTQPTIEKVSGYDGYGFGLSGNGCGFGNGGGTGYDGCFIYEKGYRTYDGTRSYNGNGYSKRYDGRRGTSRDGYGYRDRSDPGRPYGYRR